MVYLIYGNETVRIKANANKIAKEKLSVIDDFSFVRFDASRTLVQEIVDECNFFPFGCDHKVVFCEDCYFLLKPKPRNSIESDQDYNMLLDYLDNPNFATDLILSIGNRTIDEKSKIFSLIKEKGTVIAINDIDDESWSNYVRDYMRTKLQIKIDNDALKELSDRTHGDISLFRNEANKLALYKDHITYEDVDFMVNKPLEDNAFDIYNMLMSGRNGYALGIYRDLKKDSVEPVTLISMLSNQFRLLNQVVYLSKQGKSDEEIGKLLNIKPIRAKIIKRNTYTMSEDKIHSVLDKLFELDLQIKSGQVDRFYAFELFLINFTTN